MMFFKRCFVPALFLLILANSAPASTQTGQNIEALGYIRLGNLMQASEASVVHNGNRVYVLSSSSKSHCYRVDVADPQNPRKLADIPLGGLYTTMFVKGSYAIFSQRYDTPVNLIVKMNDPAPKPQTYSVPGRILASNGTILATLVGSANNQVQFWSIANPAEPHYLSSMSIPSYTNRIWNFTGSTLLTDSTTFYLSDPLNAYSIPTKSSYVYFCVSGTTAIYNDGVHAINDVIYTFDVSDPTAPVRTGLYRSNAKYMVAIDGPIAYAVTLGGELTAFDITDPGSPDSVCGRYRLPSQYGAIAAADGLIYYFDRDNGILSILRYTGDRTTSTYDAEPVGLDSAVSVAVNSQTNLSLKMRNTGVSSWSADLGFKLAVTSDSGKIVDTTNARISLPPGNVVYPGEEYTFKIPLRDASPGKYKIRLQMIHEFVTNFGPEISIKVTAKK